MRALWVVGDKTKNWQGLFSPAANSHLVRESKAS